MSSTITEWKSGAVESARGALRSHHNGAHRRTAGGGRGRDRSRGVASQPVRPDDDRNYGYRRHLSANMGTEGVGRAIAVGNAPNDAVEQALSKTSLAELVRGVGQICQKL